MDSVNPAVLLAVWTRASDYVVECCHRVEALVEAEHILVEIRLVVLPAHAVVRTVKPCLEVREDEMDHRLVRVESDHVRAELCRASEKPSRTD